MKRLIFFVLLLTCYLFLSAQRITYFHGNKVESKGETASLYSVKLSKGYILVTIELIPTKNRGRMNVWTSPYTYVLAGGEKYPILGFLDSEEADGIRVDERPIANAYLGSYFGWEKVKKGQTYHYTLVFAGSIPPGVTDFSLIDPGDPNGSRGYGFRNYTLDNANFGGTSFHNEYDVRKNIDDNNDGICGIYEGFDNQGYRLACVKENGIYKLIFLGMKEPKKWWRIGDLKATLKASATFGYFKADWYTLNKSKNANAYVVFKGGSMETVITTDNGSETSGYLKMYPNTNSGNNSSGSPSYAQEEKWSGTGFAIGNGYLVTNYHIVEKAKSISIQGIRGSFNTSYNANVAATDKNNDLAIIKIDDINFKGFGTIPYRVKTTTSDVGEDVFVLGYPLTTTMGEEIKLTTGVISSKTGFQGDVSMYQISAPVQPGNSGGPLFDGKGNIVGVVSAKHLGAENVGYAVKASYLNNLVETLSGVTLPSNNTISTLSLSEKVKRVDDFVFLISCNNQDYKNTNASSKTKAITNNSSSSTNKASSKSNNTSKSDNTSKTSNKNNSDKNTANSDILYQNPSILNNRADSLILISVLLKSDDTVLTFKYSGNRPVSIHRFACITANGVKYSIKEVEGIEYHPKYSYLSKNNTFKLHFQPIPKETTSIDFIEHPSGVWQMFGISLDQ